MKLAAVLLCALLLAPGSRVLHAQGNPRWSAPSGGLVGRLVVPRASISTSSAFEVFVELKNVGGTSTAVQVHNPFAVQIDVLDDKGNVLKPTSGRADVVSSPAWAVLPRDSYLGFKITIVSQDGAAGSQLDVVTRIWKLRRSSYVLRGLYSSRDFSPKKTKTGDAAWSGKLVLPPVPVKVL